jgi:hypothetical protein
VNGTELRMKTVNEEKIIQQFLSELLEKDLYEPIHDIFVAKGYEARIIHGYSELGKDLVATKRGSHNVVISVKRGDIDKSKWESEVESQLIQLIETPININDVDEALPKKPLLIISGKLTPMVSEMLAHRRNYYVQRGENPIEVWDLERLTREVHNQLLNVTLVGKDYFEDIQRLVLSITDKSFNKTQFFNFINKHLNFEKYSVFKLSLSYVLRRCEHMKNPYAFFFFAEYALMEIWKHIYFKKDFSLVNKYDELNELYIEGLEDWMKAIGTVLVQKYGICNLSNGLSEFIEYPLRIFDTLRRLSYLALNYYPTQFDDFKRIMESVEAIINNNYSACKSPLCEFNYNDLGLVLTSLHLRGKDELAEKWLVDIADFVIVQSLTGHRLLPLGENVERSTEFLMSTPFVENDSHLLLLLLEFSTTFDFQRVYLLIKPHIGRKLFLRAKITPMVENENEIYEREMLHSHVIKIKELQPTWSDFTKWFDKFILQNKREYSPIKENRPLLLILVSNIFRDRYFPDVWRNLIHNE